MKYINRIALAVAALALSAPLYAAPSADNGAGSGMAGRQDTNNDGYDRGMNSGGRAGGSTQPRDLYNRDSKDARTRSSSGDDYDNGMNSGGRAGGSTQSREGYQRSREKAAGTIEGYDRERR